MIGDYLVWCPELGSVPEDGRKFLAADHESAARAWARYEDAASADYWIVGGDGATVVVRGPDGSECRIRVTGETDINYTARIES